MDTLTALPFFEPALLALALSVDALVACFSYGGQGIRIPARSVVTIALVCSGILLVALLIGAQAAPYIAESAVKKICFGMLFLLGLARIFDSSLKNWIRRKKDATGKLQFSAVGFKFILHIYADPQRADMDSSRVLSVKEATVLSVALSLDGALAGFGAGLLAPDVLPAVVIFFFATIGAALAGRFLGSRLAAKLPFDISWFSGALLLLLAFLKM